MLALSLSLFLLNILKRQNYVQGKKKKCPYYKEKPNFQFCEALQDKPEFFGLGRVGDGSHTSEEDKLCGRPFLPSLGKTETSDALTGKQAA